MTSLCPALGKRNSVVKSGLCPPDLQHPRGKEFPVLIMGAYPFMITNDKKELTGGADIEIFKILAEKFGFKAEVTKAFGWVNKGGMVEKVKDILEMN